MYAFLYIFAVIGVLGTFAVLGLAVLWLLAYAVAKAELRRKAALAALTLT